MFLSSESKIHTAVIGCFKALMNNSVSTMLFLKESLGTGSKTSMRTLYSVN